MDFDSNIGMQNNQAQPNNQFQNQNTPQTCPRCHNLCNDRYCMFCGFDIVAFQNQYNQPFQNQYNQQNYQYQNYYNPNQAFYQQPNYQANVKPRNKKFVLWPFIVGGIVLITLLITGVILTFSYLSFDKNPSIESNPGIFGQTENGTIPNGVSRQELKKLVVGMSYAQVSSIIGGDGVLSDQGQTPLEENYYTYQWIGENDQNASVFITFVNDKVSDIVNNGV